MPVGPGDTVETINLIQVTTTGLAQMALYEHDTDAAPLRRALRPQQSIERKTVFRNAALGRCHFLTPRLHPSPAFFLALYSISAEGKWLTVIGTGGLAEELVHYSANNVVAFGEPITRT